MFRSRPECWLLMCLALMPTVADAQVNPNSLQARLLQEPVRELASAA
ncbi:MAG: hypothetical protein R3B90_01090 [Planctomycetaceae bacterium]